MTGDSMNYIESLVTNQEYIGVRNTIIMKYMDHIYALFQKDKNGMIELASKCKFPVQFLSTCFSMVRRLFAVFSRYVSYMINNTTSILIAD